MSYTAGFSSTLPVEVLVFNTKTSTGKVDENYFRGDPDIPNRA